MLAFFADVTAFIAAHPHLSYAAVLFLALSESIPVIGVFIPGTAAILAISALVPSGIVKLWPLLVAASVGAIIGDGLSFWLGHRYHREILQRWPLNRHPDLVRRSEAFFARHGDKSVFIARFTPGVRAFIPLLAGTLQMSVRRFYAANILSALIWAPSHILPAVFIGAAFSAFGAAAKPLAILVFLIVVVIWMIVRLAGLVLRRAPEVASNLSARLQQSSAIRRSRPGRFVLELLDPARSDIRGLALIGALLVGSAWLFFGVLEDVVSGDPLVRADAAIYQGLQALRTVPGDAAMLAITELGDPTVVMAVTIAVMLWLATKRAWRSAAFLLAAVGGASVLNTVIKVTLHRARPTEMLYSGWSAFSFPSGHSTVNFALYGFLALLIGRELRSAWRFPVAFVALSLIFLIAFSRIYLGAHWFSDVVGGVAFGTTWLSVLWLFYIRKASRPLGAMQLAAVTCLALGLAGGLNIYRHHSADVERYAVKHTMPTMPFGDWWASEWQRLPSRRIDITGEVEEPFTVQWVGEIATIQRELQHKGWRLPAGWNSTKALGWLTMSTAPVDLPVMLYLSSGQLPKLTLVLPDNTAPDGSRFVLRFWDAHLSLTDDETSPVWIGSIVKEVVLRPLSLVSVVSSQGDANFPRNALSQLLQSDHIAKRSDYTADAEWDGGVILLRSGGFSR